MLTPYQFASNSPIEAIDLDGLEAQHISGNPASGNVPATDHSTPLDFVTYFNQYRAIKLIDFSTSTNTQRISNGHVEIGK